MTHRTRWLLLAAAGTAFIAACSDDSFPALSPKAPAKSQFFAPLTAAAEKPTPSTSAATGTVNITFMDTLTIRYEVLLTGEDSVTKVDFSAADATTTGPIMFTIYNVPAGTYTVGGVLTSKVTGTLKQADILRTAATTVAGGTNVFTAPFTFDSLVTRIKAGTVYANVHTRVNPTGDIRGQVTVGAAP
jgi:CHRD domain